MSPQACLLDSGATTVRFGAYVTEICGIDLRYAPRTRLAVGGAVVAALMAEVSLEVDGGQLLRQPDGARRAQELARVNTALTAAWSFARSGIPLSPDGATA